MKLLTLLSLLLLTSSAYAQDISWSEVSEFHYDKLVTQGEKLYASGGFGIYLLLDGGATSTLIASGYADGMAIKGDTLFVSFSPCFGSREGLYYTVNDGLSWIRVNTGYDLISVDYEMCANNQYVFVAGCYGAYRSLNGGTAWQEVLPTSYTSDGGAYSITCRDSLIVIGSAHKVFISQDNGLTWISKTVPVPQQIVWEVTIHEDQIWAGTPNGMFMSNDLGNTWVHKGPYGKNISSIQFCGTTAVAGCFDEGGVLYSADAGVSWSSINAGLDESNLNVYNVILYQGDFIMSSNHLQKSQGITCAPVTALQEWSQPAVFYLFPNPTAAGLVIQTDLSRYDLVLYNEYGQPVFSRNDLQGTYTLPDHILSTSGVYRLVLKIAGQSVYKQIIKI